MASLHVLRTRSHLAGRSALSSNLVDAYVDLWRDHGASHELTISLGIHPKTFRPEEEFIPQLKRIAREIARRLRAVPKRQALKLRPEDAVWMAGFYEDTDAAGLLFPHWHGVISLSPGDEPLLRELLVECVGEDATPGSSCIGVTDRPVITTPRAKPTFDLRPLTSPARFIAYANKKVRFDEPTHWTIHDILQAST